MAENKEILDSLDNLRAIDASGMLSLVDKLPDMLAEGWVIANKADIPNAGRIDNLVISGMGGSAISGDIISLVLRDTADYPIYVNRSYSCPKFVNDKTLFIALSYSGNTEETISSFKEALNKGARIISISSGGELKELSIKNNIKHIEVPKGLPPRAALGYLLSSSLNVISRSLMINNIKDDFEEAVKLVKQLSRKYCFKSGTRENEPKLMAIKLKGRTPVIFTSEGTTYSAGLRWKTQINENSKVTAILCVFPELNHNDMVNFANLNPGDNDFSFIILRDENDLERMKRRIEITKSLISGHVGGITEVWSQGKSRLEKLMSLIIYGDYLSVYLALLSGIDPTPVEIIEKLKKELLR
jgi:glucose/mannose-6-phosphate isomerase